MLQAILNSQPYLFPILAVGWVLLVPVGVYLARRYDRPVLPAGLLAASIVAIIAVTLGGGSRGRDLAGRCTITANVVENIAGSQDLLNIAIFAPAGFLAVLVFRSVVPPTVTLVAASVAIEVLQSLVPSLGRSCDTSDLFTNTLGTVIGVIGAVVSQHNGGIRPAMRWRTGALIGAASAAIAVPVWTTAIHPPPRSATLLPASAEQDHRVRPIAQALYGPDVEILRITQSIPANGTGEPVTLSVSAENRVITMQWPSGEPTVASFVTPLGQPQAGPMDKEKAEKLATSYARAHFPWALENTTSSVYPTDGGQGWNVGWRQYVDGVLMPMRMDIYLDDQGRITGFAARHIPPQPLPKVTVPQDRARSVAYQQTGSMAKSGELLAMKSHRGWIPVWMLNLDNGRRLLINAATGIVLTPRDIDLKEIAGR